MAYDLGEIRERQRLYGGTVLGVLLTSILIAFLLSSRLRDTIAARHITDTVLVAYFGTADLDAAGVPRARELGLGEHRTGWVAASETYLAGEWVGGAYQWLLNYQPVARIGPSMRLWYIPPSETLSTTRSLPR